MKNLQKLAKTKGDTMKREKQRNTHNRLLAKLITCIIITCTALTILSGCSIIKTVGKAVGNGLSTIDYTNEEQYKIGDGEIKETIKDIKINWVSGKIKIKTGDSDKIIISEENDSSNEDFKLRYLAEGETLKIQFSKAGKWNFSNIHKELIITLPKDCQFDNFDIDSVSASCNIEGLKTKDMSVDTVSGEVNLENVYIEHFKGNAVSGDIELSGDIKDSVKVDAVSAKIKLTIPEDKGYTVDMDTTSGDFDSNFEYTGNKGRYKAGDESIKIDVDTVSGNLSIKKGAASA